MTARPKRDKRAGVALIWALVMATVALTLMAGFVAFSHGNQRLAAGLVKSYRDEAALFAVRERLRPRIARAMEVDGTGQTSDLALDGSPVEVMEAGQVWTMAVQDVEGLIDPYLTAPEVLARLPGGADLVARRDRMLARLPPGARFVPLELTLRQMGVTGEMAGLFTGSASLGHPRLRTAPAGLQGVLQGLPPGLREGEQVRRVGVVGSKRTDW